MGFRTGRVCVRGHVCTFHAYLVPPSVASLVAQMVKRLPAKQETRVQSLRWEDPLEKEMAIHSSTLAWRIPWTEDPGRLQSMGLQRVGHDWATFLSLFLIGLYWKARTIRSEWALAFGVNTAVSGASLSSCWWFKPLMSASPSGMVEQVEQVEVTLAEAIICSRVWGAPGAHCLLCPAAVASGTHNSGYKEITRSSQSSKVWLIAPNGS